MKERFDRFSFVLAEIYRYWHKIASSVMKKYGLKGSCAVYFTAIQAEPNGLTAAELSKICSRNKADVSRIISQATELGYIKKDNESKSYKAKLFLTEKGEKIAKEVSEKSRHIADMVTYCVTNDERENFYATMELIAKNMKNISQEQIEKMEKML